MSVLLRERYLSSEDVLPLNERFTNRILSLFGDSVQSREVANGLLAHAEELVEWEKGTFALTVGEKFPRDESVRKTRLIFRRSDLDIQVYRDKHGAKTEDVSLHFDCKELSPHGILKIDRSVLFVDRSRDMLLRIHWDGSVSYYKPVGNSF